MSDTVPSQGSRITAARDRLYDALGASNAQEGEVVRYITRALPIDAVELLVAMAERAASKARADGYEKGWTEAGGVQ